MNLGFMHNLIALGPDIWWACLETAMMVGIGMLAAVLLGGPLGIWLFLSRPGQMFAHPLLNRVLEEGRGMGARRATLEVRASNEGARRLYERMGFYVAGIRRDYYTNPVEDALVLWREDNAPGQDRNG